ncbi:MAG: MotA/TolQ/ExbB proton channel family protein [Opitutales bacterium]
MKKLLVFLTFTGTAVALGQAETAPATEAAAAGQQNLFDLIVQGGWAMWPLGLCSLFMLFLVVFCFLQTGQGKFVPGSLCENVNGLLREHRVDEARQALEGNNTVFSRSLFAALGKARPDAPDGNKGKVEEALSENLEAEENAIAQWVNYLNVIAAVAPMIGLLGTVSGMISAFQVLASRGFGQPELLAGNIGEALVTTATGLTIGIPAMIFYFILRNRLGSRMILAVQAASTAADELDPASAAAA